MGQWSIAVISISSPDRSLEVCGGLALWEVTERVTIDFLDWGFYAIWQTPLVWGEFSPNRGCHSWLVEKPDMCFWFVKITGLFIGWSDFGKIDQSEEVLFLIIYSSNLFSFLLLVQFYFGPIYWIIKHFAMMQPEFDVLLIFAHS